jgi:hypothetical protein
MIDYKLYPKNWKTEIRPAILKRAGDKCEFCGVPNKAFIFRGKLEDDTEVYQMFDGSIYREKDSVLLYDNEEGFRINVEETTSQKAITVVLTIAHLDHDISNNDYGNLKALCQRCHLNLDKEQHTESRAKTRRRKSLNQEMEL